jgi:hypothetical protein
MDLNLDITYLLLVAAVAICYWVHRDTLRIRAKREERGKKWW